MTRRLRFYLAAACILLVLAVSLALEACTRPSPVDVHLMAYLSEARALHHEASVHESNNDMKSAIAALEKLINARRPDSAGPAPEIEEVLADTHARVAELRTRTGDLEGASRDVALGLNHAPSRTYFRGHLLEVAGVLEQARASQLADAGNEAGASEANKKAIDLLRQAVSIQDEVIQTSLGREAGK